MRPLHPLLRYPPPHRPRRWASGLALALLLSGTALPAWSQLQTGRDAKGNLWISDQGLPAGIKAHAADTVPVMSLPSASTTNNAPTPTASNPTIGIGRTPPTQATQAQSTCRDIGQRYTDAQTSLNKTEQDKAAGRLLIADTGLVTMRQNLATLARLKELCR